LTTVFPEPGRLKALVDDEACVQTSSRCCALSPPADHEGRCASLSRRGGGAGRQGARRPPLAI